MSIKPPSEMARVPRSICDRKNWKAAEWRYFLLYYSYPCVKNLLPSKYLQHWCSLIYCIYTFLQPVVMPNEKQNVELQLRQFVANVQSYYGMKFLKFNTHLLLHVGQCVTDFGALWAHSTFRPFERYNGVLTTMFYGSKAIPMQIVKKYLRYQKVENLCRQKFTSQRCDKTLKDWYACILISIFYKIQRYF